MLNNWVLSMVFFFFITLLSSLPAISVAESLRPDFYRDSCPRAEGTVKILMSGFFLRHPGFPAQLLRLYFHDCFSQGCDASILLDGSGSEKEADPNFTVKGFEEMDQIKEAVEKLCPLVVSCADILAIAARDAVVLSGGPFYKVATGRRDSAKPFFKEAMEEIPGPSASINQVLEIFAAKGFDERETVSLLGAHNVGKIGCEFILNRLHNFSGTGAPDKSIVPRMLHRMRSKCQVKKGSSNGNPALVMSYSHHRHSSLSLKGVFTTQFYKSLLDGTGLLFSDQQLMLNENTAKLVKGYASDGGLGFRNDFPKAMLKLSAFNVLTGSQGVIRQNCRS